MHVSWIRELGPPERQPELLGVIVEEFAVAAHELPHLTNSCDRDCGH